MINLHPWTTLALINSAICIGLAFHGICMLNQTCRKTPLIMRLGYILFTVCCVGVAIGPAYGLVTSDPLEIGMNAGLLIFLIRAAFARAYIHLKGNHGRIT